MKKAAQVAFTPPRRPTNITGPRQGHSQRSRSMNHSQRSSSMVIRKPTKKNETFVKAPPWLYRTNPRFSDPAVRAYLALREHHRENGSGKGAIPAAKTVAGIIGVSERTAWRAIKELREAGAIVS